MKQFLRRVLGRQYIAGLQDQLAHLQEQVSGLRRSVDEMAEKLQHLPEHFLAPDGLPIPPAELRLLVSGEDDLSDFFAAGSRCSRQIAQTLKKSGVDLESFRAILDFGCGCGRTLRYFRSLKNPRLYGTDLNAGAVGWCKEHLPFAEYSVNSLAPPLAHADETFDLIYAFSVFTHLPEKLQFLWMNELSRLLKNGAYLVISTLDDNYLPDDSSLKARFRSGGMVVIHEDVPGSSDCGAYHSFSYVTERLATGFELIEYIPGGVGQNFFLFKKQPRGLS